MDVENHFYPKLHDSIFPQGLVQELLTWGEPLKTKVYFRCVRPTNLTFASRFQLTAFYLTKTNQKKKNRFCSYCRTPNRPKKTKILLIITKIGFQTHNYPIPPANVSHRSFFRQLFNWRGLLNGKQIDYLFRRNRDSAKTAKTVFKFDIFRSSNSFFSNTLGLFSNITVSVSKFQLGEVNHKKFVKNFPSAGCVASENCKHLSAQVSYQTKSFFIATLPASLLLINNFSPGEDFLRFFIFFPLNCWLAESAKIFKDSFRSRSSNS